MDANTLIWIVVAILAAIAVVAAVFVVLRARRNRRLVEAKRLREEVDEHSAWVDKREALAGETAAKARAAEAEAQAKAAEAARLKDQATSHHEAVATSREELEERRQRADRLDPKRGRDDAAEAGTPQSSPAKEQYERR